ncbi:thiopeptide-type bacteriocin biosynthesis domain-containing protein [Sinosporangium album]|uniref:Thiopeptide-type bacteriocin biosynthesis domain-containing protein n=1 Tax=Sinosporangium album TaxID=504805 RepID=A0A1G8IML0_9ACTN|nr:lantibiotic dehydratase [Sinosporangium album]SDI20186.1 thiopeptide-type bacteriocin biosynthesis domain-containing protein [Sinosporangium album]
MVSVPPRYQHTGLVVVRASTDPGDLELPEHLDLDLGDPAAFLQEGRAWLAKAWARGDVHEALLIASPALATRINALITSATVSASDVRRAILSTVTYLLRWQRRPTPFGLFAGVATADIGPAHADIGTRHQAFARVDADWITRLIDQIEQHQRLRPHLTVIANSLGVIRDGRFIVATRARGDTHAPGSGHEVSVRLTRPMRLVLALATAPIRFDQLATQLAGRFPETPAEKILALLHTLVDQHILITNLRPPMTAADPLSHLLDVLHDADGEDLADVSALLRDLEHLRDLLARHNAVAAPERAAAIRATISTHMAALASGSRPAMGLAIDVALDARITIPEPVLQEAAHAATVLLRLSTEPFGRTAWMDYHARFLARYGPGVLVPVKELVADSGLGFPAGYLGAPRARPTWRTLTERDAHLLTLIQKATMTGADEITLIDADVTALTIGDHDTVVTPQRVEIGVALHATSTEAISRGEFGLRVVATPRACTSMAGRFAHLLDEDEQARLAASHRHCDGAVAVQLSFPPRRSHNENVTRVPPLVPELVHLGEHPGNGAIDVGDLSVTADAAHLHLVQSSTGRLVVPRVGHALDTVVQTPPLARFLAEVADARSAIYGPFNYGAARTLPYLPRIRYRRTILAAARWLLTPADLQPSVGQDWDAALQAWRHQTRAPARVLLCHEDLRLPLDLDQPLDRAVLRTRLGRAGRVELQEDHLPEGGGWIGRPAELLIPLTAIDSPPRHLPITTAPGLALRPGDATVLCAHLVGNPARFDGILTHHLPALISEVADLVTCWWVRRHRDMIRLDADQHLAVFLRLADSSQYGPVAARLAALAAHLEARGLPAHLTLTTYREQPGRYGEGAALAAAEQVFAADTRAAITQITMATSTGLPGQALAAASMAHLAAAFAPDRLIGYRTLVRQLEQQTGPLDRALRGQALDWSDPTGDYQAVRALPDGEAVAAAWQARDAALADYHHTLAQQRAPATVLRTLLHDHHVRALGVDPEFEKVTIRLTRAAAMRRLALAGA